jgi:F-type H+-transporting ATPase subunit alpha
VRRFEEDLLRHVRDKAPDILEAIRTEKEISDKTEQELEKAVSEFSKAFAA